MVPPPGPEYNKWDAAILLSIMAVGAYVMRKTTSKVNIESGRTYNPVHLAVEMLGRFMGELFSFLFAGPWYILLVKFSFMIIVVFWMFARVITR